MKKTITITLLLLLIIKSFSQPPSWSWIKNIKGDNYVFQPFITTDASGNVYTVGKFENTVDFDPSTDIYNLTATTGNFDIFITKFDPAGNFVWAKAIGGPGLDEVSAIASNKSNNNIYITGSYTNTADFDPSDSTYYLTSQSFNVFILGLDFEGNFLFAKNIGGIGVDVGQSINTDIQGNIYITGKFSSIVDFDPSSNIFNLSSNGSTDIFILKCDSAGNFIWAKAIGGIKEDEGNSIGIDVSGNIYTTGTFIDTVDFDPGIGIYSLNAKPTVGNVTPNSIFISKLDSSGNFIWVRQLGKNIYTQQSNSLEIDYANNVIITGCFKGILDFDPDSTTYNLTSDVDADMFICKLNNLGLLKWANNIGGTSYASGNSIDSDSKGNIIVSGTFQGLVDFNADSLSVYNINAPNGNNHFILKTDSLGNFIWIKNISSFGDNDYNSIAVDAFDNIYMCGQLRDDDNVTFDSLSIIIPNNEWRIFTSKILENFSVWPGDTDNSKIVDNSDLLPLGVYFGQIGFPRDSITNVWQANASTDWGIIQSNSNGFDIKHIDCNGDSSITFDDTLAININFNLNHPINTYQHNFERETIPDLYFVTGSDTVNSGDTVKIELWAGTSDMPANNLYGIAFNINYSGQLVVPGTLNLNFNDSWIGTVNSNAIKIVQTDYLNHTLYAAITRINHTNSHGYGKIAELTFKANTTSITSAANLFISRYIANDSSGTPIIFNTLNDSVIIEPLVNSVEEEKIPDVLIYPNPSSDHLYISFSEQDEYSNIKIINMLGQEIINFDPGNKALVIETDLLEKGIYFVQILMEDGHILIKKIITN